LPNHQIFAAIDLVVNPDLEVRANRRVHMWHCTVLLDLTFESGFNTALIIYTVRKQHCSMLLSSGVQSESSGHLIFRSISCTEQRGILKSGRVI